MIIIKGHAIMTSALLVRDQPKDRRQVGRAQLAGLSAETFLFLFRLISTFSGEGLPIEWTKAA